jgi:site-specific DNA-adenine methylase
MKKYLIPPCAYQGGKQRLSKIIVDEILKNTDSTTNFVDLCCGSGAISLELINRGTSPKQITMVDLSPWGLFWESIGNETFNLMTWKFCIDSIPTDPRLIKSYVEHIRNSKPGENKLYEFLILQACSFGSTPVYIKNGIWNQCGFRNYWTPTATSNRKSHVNPMMPMPQTLYQRVVDIVQTANGVCGYCTNVETFAPEKSSVVYIDPPYQKTSGYGYNFDYMTFIKNNPTTKIYLSEGISLSENSILLSNIRKKGGISGSRKSSNEEWLNIFGS